MIYFDNAATTLPLSKPHDIYYNPSSPHNLGIISERRLRNAREKIAAILNCNVNELIFTSGGTESNNIAILGYALSNTRQDVNLLCLPYEHPSITAPMQVAHERGWAIYSALNYNNIPDGNILCSLSHVNHETGDIHDIKMITTIIKNKNPKAIIHIDGVQSICKEDLWLENIDLYSFSGHKCHGPSGTGGLWIRKGLRITPIIHGGGQENGLRAGTENVTGLVNMAEAIIIMHKNLYNNHRHVYSIKEILMQLCDDLPDVTINTYRSLLHGNDADYICGSSPYILNMSFLGIKGEVLVHALSRKDIHVSMGAACNRNKRVKTALEQMGFSTAIADSAIRFSFSAYNTKKEAEIVRDTVITEVTRLRKYLYR